MFIYEKNKKLYGTNTTPSANDQEVVYKDENNTVITLNENDSYFDNGAGGITRKSDGKTVDILFNNKYVVPRGKEGPGPGPEPVPTTITWDGEIGERYTIILKSNLTAVRMTNALPGTTESLIGKTVKFDVSGQYSPGLKTHTILEEDYEQLLTGVTGIRTEISEKLDSYVALLVEFETTYATFTFKPGVYFIKSNDSDSPYYTTYLSYEE